MDDVPRLVLLSYPSGQPLEVAGPSAIVGRHSEADVRLPMPDVSRRHCRISYENDAWRVTDLTSTNGTFVNGLRIAEAELHPGDRLRVAGFEFEVPRVVEKGLRKAS